MDLKYFRIYAAIGIYDPEPMMDVTLLSNDGVVVRLLGANSYASVLDHLGALKKSTGSSYLIHSDSNAILYISVSQSFADIDLKRIKDDEGLNLEKLPHKAKAVRAFGVAATAISLARFSKISKDYEFIFDGYYAIDESSGAFRELHHYNQPREHTMMRIDREEIQTAICLSETLRNDEELQAIIDLFSRSLEPYENGLLQAFISAWTGLEMFIVKQFKTIQKGVGITIKGRSAHPIFSDRMLDVMKDKYRLLDKFVALSSYLNETDSDDDILLFKKIKSIRDDFFHSMVGSVEFLPLNETRGLLEKYLKIYLVNERKTLGLSIKKS